MVILNISGELEYANNRFKKWVDLSALKLFRLMKLNNQNFVKY